MSAPAPPPHTHARPSAALTMPDDPWLSLAVFFAIVGVFQWSSVLHSKLLKRRRTHKGPDEESPQSSLAQVCTRQVQTGWSLARLPLAAVNVFRVVAFRWTIEFGSYELKVVDVVLTLGYIAFLFGWTFQDATRYGITSNNLWPWSGRAGLLAASQFPLVTALGTKNNVVTVVTGVSYEKLNYLHRVAARSCFALLLFHAAGEIYSTKRNTLFGLFIQERFLRLGFTAVASLAILLIVAMRPIRTRYYEIFFYTHFVAVFIFLIGAYFHTRHVGASYWIWPSFMFWALDRFVRLLRIVISNHLYCGFSRRAKLQDATTEVLSDDFVRVRVRRPAHFQWSPGQTAYLTMPSVSTFPLEAHPFSIASVDSALFHPNTRDRFSLGAGDAASWKELVFLINVRGGFTRRLKAAAEQNQRVKVLIDGPYGSAPDMAAYDTAVFVAGGSGVTYTLPVFLNVIEAARKGSSNCRRVVFIWAVRDASHLRWISEALYQAHALTPSWLGVSIRIFATRGSEMPLEDPDPERTPDKEGGHDWAPPSVRLERGRPDLGALLGEEWGAATGSMSVTVCGSQGLTRSVRRALRFPVSGFRSVMSGGPSVTLHVESFGYA